MLLTWLPIFLVIAQCASALASSGEFASPPTIPGNLLSYLSYRSDANGKLLRATSLLASLRETDADALRRDGRMMSDQPWAEQNARRATPGVALGPNFEQLAKDLASGVSSWALHPDGSLPVPLQQQLDGLADMIRQTAAQAAAAPTEAERARMTAQLQNSVLRYQQTVDLVVKLQRTYADAIAEVIRNIS